MTIPTVLERNETGLSEFLRPSRPVAVSGLDPMIAEEESPIRPQVANRATFEIEPFHEVENNEDQKSPGYPDGPICIYDDGVFLYLEPSAEEAARFDVVINVAREVVNPFTFQSTDKNQPSPSTMDSPIPDTAVTTASFATAFEFFPDEHTPTTPKAQSLKEPEYIHMPWDHNTDIGGDLMSLCETIERKTREGKKVLVHCQQGASRSASLIIAYGIYQNPGLSVNDAYHAAQAKSRWISPNMRLMYCLQDFQKEVTKKKAPSAGLKLRPGKSPTKHRMTLSASNIEVSPKEPLTAPLPTEGSTRGVAPERSPTRARGNSTPNRGEPISPGPSSAPSSFSWTEKEDEKDPGKHGRFNLDSMVRPPPQPDSGFSSGTSLLRPPSPKGIPSISVPPASPGFAPINFSLPLASPRFPPPEMSLPPSSPGFAPAMTFPNPPPSPGFSSSFPKPPPSPGFGAHRFGSSTGGLGFVPLSLAAAPPPKLGKLRKEAAPEMKPVPAVLQAFPEDPALLSPRAETMTKNPLHEPFTSFAGMQFVEVPPTPGEGLFSPRETMCPRDPFFPFGRPMQNQDPRSPPNVGETPIVRSIDDMI